MSNIELKWNLPEGITAVPIPKDPPTFVSAGERLCLYTALTGGTIKVYVGQALMAEFFITLMR